MSGEKVGEIQEKKIEFGYKGSKRTLTVMIVLPYSFLNSLNRLPSTSLAITSLISNGLLRSVPTIP